MDETSLIVIGSLNTDIIATGVRRFPQAGEHVYGKELTIGPGGKSRNIAAMAARLSPEGQVAMIGRTAEDAYGLWKPPVEALRAAGVNIDCVQVVALAEAQKLPAIALIPVNEQGENQIIVLPGVSGDFNRADIDAGGGLFAAVSRNKGLLALTLECPYDTACYAVEKAVAAGIKVALDPGGIEEGNDISALLAAGLYIIKPNEHEARMLSGVEVIDFASARQAAQRLQALGVQNVLITHGAEGAYLFTDSGESHIAVSPNAVSADATRDATGCGDQTMATLCAYLQMGKSLKEAAEIAVLSGTLQFYKSGIQPVTTTEIKAQLRADG